jgi:hypothetical protein
MNGMVKLLVGFICFFSTYSYAHYHRWTLPPRENESIAIKLLCSNEEVIIITPYKETGNINYKIHSRGWWDVNSKDLSRWMLDPKLWVICLTNNIDSEGRINDILDMWVDKTYDEIDGDY